MNMFTYYIMTQRVDMRLIASQTVPKKTRTHIMNANNILPQKRQRISPFVGNVFKGNMNGVFDARGRPCG